MAVRYTRQVSQQLTSAPAAGGRAKLRFIKDPGTVPRMMLKTIDGKTLDSNDFNGKIVLVNFWATWCPPCRAFAPVFERASEKHGDITFAKVDTDAEQLLAAEFEIRSIPTIMAVRDGIVVFSQPGALPERALESLIEQVRALDMDEVRAKAESAAK